MENPAFLGLGGSPGCCCVPSTCPHVTGALCEVTMVGLYVFLLGLVLPQFLMAFAWRSSVSIRGILLPIRRMRALRGEGLVGGWALIRAGGSVRPSRVLGAASHHLSSCCQARARGSWLRPLPALREAAGDRSEVTWAGRLLSGLPSPSPAGLSLQSPCPSPGQLRAPVLDSPQRIAAVLSLRSPGWAQSPRVVFPLLR